MNAMKAVRICAYGGSEALVYEDMPCPRPAAGEVLPVLWCPLFVMPCLL